MAIIKRLLHAKSSMHLVCGLLLLGCVGIMHGATDQWTNIGPQGVSASSMVIHPSNPKILYAGTRSNGIFNFPYQLAVDPKNPQTLYLAVMDGPRKSNDGGLSWNSAYRGIPAGARIDRIAVDPVNPKIVYAALGTIYKSLDAGQNWAKAGTGLPPSVAAFTVDPQNPQTVYAAVSDGAVYRTVNGGQNWVPFNSGLADQTILNIVVDPQNSRNVCAGSQSNGVYSMTTGTLYLADLYFPQVADGGGYLANFALVNPDNTTAKATLKLTLYNGSGSQVGQKEVALPAMNQTAQRIEAFFPEATAGFTGTLAVASSGGAVARTTLRYNASLSALASTPVVPSSIWPSYPHFAQIADGGGYKSTITLLNLSNFRASAELEIYGQDGTPWPLDLNGTVNSRHPVELPANGLLLLESPSRGSSATPGWARLVRSNGPIGGSIIYSYQGKLISAAGIGESTLTERLYLPVDTRSGFYTGLAIANPNSQPVTLDLQLYDRQGTLVGRKSRILEGLKQLAELEFQLFPETPMTDFTGSILVSSTGGQVIATVLRFDFGSSVFASLPVGLLP